MAARRGAVPSVDITSESPSGGVMKDLVIDVYSDFMCPWCFIGSRRLQEALESFPDVAVVTRYHPYPLHRDVPPDGIDLRASLARRYGQNPDRLFGPVEAAARQTGIALDFSKITRVQSTLDAHTLVRHAERQGTAREFSDAVFAAHFLDSRNIANRDVLADIAVRHGFSQAEVYALLDDADERRRTIDEAERTIKSSVRGVPLYVLNGRVTVSGAQRTPLFRAAIDRGLASAA
jgi:predicted DsbA family dithiol-disulfide isomerase